MKKNYETIIRTFNKSDVVAFAKNKKTERWVVLLERRRGLFRRVRQEWVELYGDFDLIVKQYENKPYKLEVQA